MIEKLTEVCINCGVKCGTRYKCMLYVYAYDTENLEHIADIEIGAKDKEGNQQYLCCECVA